jgi:predicted flap endonuclease-1-like 5' DNA nuclease
MANLVMVEGIGETYAQKLKAAGISSTEELLEVGATPKGRHDIAEKSGISDTLILKWVNHVDLFRINGVGEEYADLLEAAGVDTVPELGQRNAENLHKKLEEVNEAKKKVRQVPALSAVTKWIEEAKTLPRKINY